MSAKYQNKYRIESNRLQEYDYGRNGAYFITICTAKRKNYFGEIIPSDSISEPLRMNLNDSGKIAELFLQSIPAHFSCIILDQYIVMPNHVHMILIINKPDIIANLGEIENNFVETLHCNVSTDGHVKNIAMSRISPKPGTISTIIRSYKSEVTKHVRKCFPSFAWQTRFYDHVIQNEKSLMEIREYIYRNVQNWNSDRNNRESDEYVDF